MAPMNLNAVRLIISRLNLMINSCFCYNLNFSTNNFDMISFFSKECRVEGWKAKKGGKLMASGISLKDCKDKCYNDPDCHAFEADCTKHSVSIISCPLNSYLTFNEIVKSNIGINILTHFFCF